MSSAIEPLDAIFESDGVVVVPGIQKWLGLTDYQQSIESKLTESFEDFCTRISKEA